MDTFTAPFILIRDDGWAMEFVDLASLYAAVNEAKINVEKYHVAYLTWRGDDLRIHGDGISEHKHINNWIVRDDRGKIVTSEDIRAAAPPYRYRGKYWWRRRDLQAEAASLGPGVPIPYTGKRNRHRGCYHRLPQTLNVLRSIAAFEADERYEDVRPKGKIKNVPNAWDDIGRAAYYDRNWKRNRKTQWR